MDVYEIIFNRFGRTMDCLDKYARNVCPNYILHFNLKSCARSPMQNCDNIKLSRR